MQHGLLWRAMFCLSTLPNMELSLLVCMFVCIFVCAHTCVRHAYLQARPRAHTHSYIYIIISPSSLLSVWRNGLIYFIQLSARYFFHRCVTFALMIGFNSSIVFINFVRDPVAKAISQYYYTQVRALFNVFCCYIHPPSQYLKPLCSLYNSFQKDSLIQTGTFPFIYSEPNTHSTHS